MSTRCSLIYEFDETTGQTVHLYENVFDEDNIYLEVIGFPFEASSSIELSGKGPGRVAIRLPHEWAKKLGLRDPRKAGAPHSSAPIDVARK